MHPLSLKGKAVRRFILPVFAVALASCSPAGNFAPPPQAAPLNLQRSLTSLVPWLPARRPDKRRSWFSPTLKANRAPVLFVSDAVTADVYLYTLPELKLSGTITGFTQPQGECSDTKGDVWVADSGAREIYELSRAGRLKNDLMDTAGVPVACAWDPTTRNLAIFDYFGSKSSAGSILVYAHGTGTPIAYENPKQYYYSFGGYDTQGNLFFDGQAASGEFILSELPRKAKVAETLKLSGPKIHFPGMVQWDPTGTDLIVGDQNCGNQSAACTYAVTVAGKHALVGAQTMLANYQGGQVCDMAQGVVSNGQLAGSDNDFCAYTASTTNLWSYPAGGVPVSYDATTDSAPVGAAISGAASGASRGKSWMKTGTSATDLLYISDGNGEVAVYQYDSQTIVGVLTHFKNPMGECSDSKGDVFITDNGDEKIFEYRHGGTKAVAELADSQYEPYACSVNPATGNLAVANHGEGTAEGNLAIYAHAKGRPVYYTDKKLANIEGCAYDYAGDLLVTNGSAGTDDYSAFAWLPKKGKQLIDVTLPPAAPGERWGGVIGVQWDGQYWAIETSGAVYREIISHDLGYYVGETYFEESSYAALAFYDPDPRKQATQIVGGSAYTVDYYDYPASGNPTLYLEQGIDDVQGLTFSLGAHRR